MQWMFKKSAYNKPLDKWDVSNVTNMGSLFMFSQFNQPINNWNVSKVPDMSRMFQYSKNFNQPFDKWDTSQVTNMSNMFCNAAAYKNHDLRSWNVPRVKNHDDFMKGAGSGNNEPLWLPRNIVQDATVTFSGIRWYATNDPKDQNTRNCIKYGSPCCTGSDYTVHTQNLSGMVITFKWNKTYLNGEFVYNDRPTYLERIKGSNVVFLKNGSEVDRYRAVDAKKVHRYKTTKEFDQINIHYSSGYQTFLSIEVNVDPQ
jgi:surface protein